MKTVILSGSENSELKHLTTGTNVGLLHFVSKPLINVTLELLEDALGSSQFLAKGAGKLIDSLISNARNHLLWGSTLNQAPNSLDHEDEAVLWLRDDVVYDVDFKKTVLQLQQQEENVVVVNADNNPVMFYRNNKVKSVESVYPIFTEKMTTEAYCDVMLKAFSWKSVEVNTDQANIIDSVSNFHRLSMKVLKGECNYVVLDHHQVGKKLIKGSNVNLQSTSQKQKYAYLGDSVYVNADAELHDEVILCNNSYIDGYVDISNSIVLPNVYIGRYLRIHNAVVTKNSVIRIDTGNRVPIMDQNMITELLLRAG